jgi:hypothetical protein
LCSNPEIPGHSTGSKTVYVGYGSDTEFDNGGFKIAELMSYLAAFPALRVMFSIIIRAKPMNKIGPPQAPPPGIHDLPNPTSPTHNKIANV